VKKAALKIYAMALFALLAACGEPNQRLDEYVFYDGPQFSLKVVRYYRNIPFNFLGEHAVVMCRSENTTKFQAPDQQDAGWRVLGAGDGQGSRDARQAALRMQDDYEVFDDRTLIAKTNVFNISFDACEHFINWDPSRLPQAMIDPVEKPDSCAPNGPVDCRHYDFEGDRSPAYEQISIATEGQVAFTARSKAFKSVELLRVQTRNNGAVWHVKTAGYKVNRHQAREGALEYADGQRLNADAVGSLPMPLLEKGMSDVSLMDWLESALPPRSMVIWPDALGACGETQEKGSQAPSTPCAEILFNDSDGNSGALYVTMNTDSNDRPVDVSFHSAVYTSSGRPRPLGSLGGLRERLAAATE
jgi:hypothetical protein